MNLLNIRRLLAVRARDRHADPELLDAARALLREVERLTLALTEIADADYRGNRSPESTHAHLALLAEGLRQ